MDIHKVAPKSLLCCLGCVLRVIVLLDGQPSGQSEVQSTLDQALTMTDGNQSRVTEFLFLGFPGLNGFKIVVFLLILLIYIITISINLMIIVLVSTKQKLHFPMYFFLKHLSLTEISFLTAVLPNMLRVIWMEGATISVTCCITQTYVYVALGSTECYLLTVISYDRYLAICNPLHYITIMSPLLRHYLAILFWVFGFLITLITLSYLCQLHFCGPRVIYHFFCDLVPFVELSCSHTNALQIEILVLTFPIAVIPFILILSTYLCVLITILGISTTSGRNKSFSTCSSHLSVVSLYYDTMFVIYFVPAKGHSLSKNKVIVLMYIVDTPLFNPIIYCLRNQEM
ncbi:olfactory receptor 6B1-like [Rhinoderma darwinii]|uniref:olfactory receptor 6B1-like n=1 Tax=Rhinoderma darwinii TaxID=43563 RepID=UPI003F66FB88